MEPLHIGVIGLGRIAGMHLPALASFPEVRLGAIVDFRDDRRAEVGDRYGVRRRYATVEAMLKDAAQGADAVLDAVWILTNVQYTVEVTIACLEAGLHTFIEKPPGLYVDETRQMAQVARAAERLTMVGFNRRFNPLVQSAREAIMGHGAIGHLLSQWHKNNLPRLLETLGAVVARTLLRNDLIHPLDLLRHFGGPIQQIHALRRRRYTEYEDAFDALIEFESGAVGHLVSGHKSPRKIERLQLVGDQVLVELEGEDSSFTRGTIWEPGQKRELRLDNRKRTDRFGFWDEDRFFVDHLLRHQPVGYPGADLEEAVETVAMADAFVLR